MVLWPHPKPGLKVFPPTVDQPEGVAMALPYALFLREHLGLDRIEVELEPGVDWQPAWGELVG